MSNVAFLRKTERSSINFNVAKIGDPELIVDSDDRGQTCYDIAAYKVR